MHVSVYVHVCVVCVQKCSVDWCVELQPVALTHGGGRVATHLPCSESPSSCSGSRQGVSWRQHSGGCVQHQHNGAHVLQSR